MKRLISIALCFALLGCVESPEERTAFKKEVEAIRLATEVLPGEIARLKAELQAAQEPNRSPLSLSGVNEHTLEVRPNALRNLSLGEKSSGLGISFLDWATDQSLLQYPIYETMRMDEGYENYFDNACPSVFTREHLRRAKAVYELNKPVLNFFKNIVPRASAAKHRLLEPFIATIVPELIIHHQQIVALADWEDRLAKLYAQAETGALPSLQDFVDAGFQAGLDSDCEKGIGWDETRAWFYGFWMRRHADGTLPLVERLMATLVGQDQLNITTRMHSRGCIPPFTYSPQGCTYSFDWDDDGKAEVLTFVGNNLRVSHPDGSVPTRSYPWSYYKPNQPQQGLSYKIIPASLSGVPLLAVSANGATKKSGVPNAYHAYHPSRGVTVAFQYEKKSWSPAFNVQYASVSPDKTLIMKDEADPEAVEMKRCFKDGFYRDCAPSPDVAPADCITCPEELPQCEDGCADCLITSSSCKACATATCLKVKAPTEPPPENVPPTNEQPANAEQ